MTIAYSCVLLAIIFPYVFTVLAKSGGRYDNHDPRNYLGQLTGWHKRANCVQMNSFEINPSFFAAVIIANLAHANAQQINALAVTYVISRILYGACYLIDAARIRTLCFTLSAASIIGLFYISF